MQSLRRKFGLLAGLAATAILVCGSLSAQPAHAAVTTTYGFPCGAYGSAYYAFGQYVSGWGYHVGEDVCKAAGMPIYATANGTVVYSARTPSSYRWGNLIMIQHDNANGSRAVSLYGHLSDSRRVRAGQTVSKGQLIGYVGPSYSAQNGNWGAHLHFGIHPGGYNAATGTYAAWVHGYAKSTNMDGWVRASTYVSQRRAAYDSYPVSVSGGGQLTYNGANVVKFSVRNSGTEPWHTDGDHPVRLGTLYPRDHDSPFAQGGDGWLSGNRIALDADTAPGEVGTFTAVFSSNHRPGSYRECFGVLLTGASWISGQPSCVNLQVLPPMYRASYSKLLLSSQSDPTSLGNVISEANLVPGQQVNVKFIMKNTGELTWNTAGSQMVKLGADNPPNRNSAWATRSDSDLTASENWLSASRASGLDGKYDAATNSIVPAERILPGESGVFSFTVTAPSKDGLYKEYFTPAVDGVAWFNRIGMYVPLRVMSPGYHYSYVSYTKPATVEGTMTSTYAAIRLRNIGRESWPVGGKVRLGTAQASPFYLGTGSNPWLAPNRPSAVDRNITVPGKTTVGPGEIAEFSMDVNIPNSYAPGTYKLPVQPLVEGEGWLPEQSGLFFPITIATPALDFTERDQAFSTSVDNLRVGDPLTVTIRLRNTGRAAWPVAGPNAVKLGTWQPRDHASALYVGSGSDAWDSPNRASRIEGRYSRGRIIPDTEISPGESAIFRIPLSTAKAGNFVEHFNLVQSGIGWVAGDGISVALTITN